MDGTAIASQPLGHAGLRALATEQDGPRAAGTPMAATEAKPRAPAAGRATRP